MWSAEIRRTGHGRAGTSGADSFFGALVFATAHVRVQEALADAQALPGRCLGASPSPTIRGKTGPLVLQNRPCIAESGHRVENRTVR